MPVPYIPHKCHHKRKECKHGVMQMQCKCMGEHDVEIVPCRSDCKGLQKKLGGT